MTLNMRLVRVIYVVGKGHSNKISTMILTSMPTRMGMSNVIGETKDDHNTHVEAR